MIKRTNFSEAAFAVAKTPMAVLAAAGFNHSVLVTAAGTLWAWGDGCSGRLGYVCMYMYTYSYTQFLLCGVEPEKEFMLSNITSTTNTHHLLQPTKLGEVHTREMCVCWCFIFLCLCVVCTRCFNN